MPTSASALLLLLVAAPSMAADLPTVSDRELSIGGVALDAEESTVLQTLGRPTRVVTTGDFLNLRLEYPGLTIWLGEGRRVGEILSTSSERCTAGGICPGMGLSQITDLYGSPMTVAREDGQFMEYLPESDFPCWLQLAVDGDIIKSVRVECQP